MIDFLETNGQKMFQHTLHLADAKGGPQRYEVSYTEAANTECWEWDETKRPTFYELVQLLRNDHNYSQSDNIIRQSSFVDDLIYRQKYEQNNKDDDDKNPSLKNPIQF